MIVACKLIILFLYSYMLLFKHARVFFPRFLESRNYKIQIVARVGRKSAVAPSGIMEASYSHFFIGQGFEKTNGDGDFGEIFLEGSAKIVFEGTVVEL